MKYENRRAPTAVILATGKGAQLSPLTDDCPPALLSVGGSVMIERTIRNCLSCGMSQFVIVLGNRADQVRQFVDKTFRGIRVNYVINDRYRETGDGYSLMVAASAIASANFIKFNVEMVFDVRVLRRLVDSDLSNVLCIDHSISADLKSGVALGEGLQISGFGVSDDPEVGIAPPISIDRISAKTAALLFAELNVMMENPARLGDGLQAAYAQLIDSGTAFYGLDVSGLAWTHVASNDDFSVANQVFRTPIKIISREQQRAVDDPAESADAPI